ncbi:MAG: hypothetical protein ACPGXK_01415 [Phycisphaerae bacterium]
MSTIIAVQKNEQIAIAWDSQHNIGPNLVVNRIGMPKVTRLGQSWVGTTGFSVYANLLAHYMRKVKADDVSLHDESAIFEFLITFWKSIQEDYHMVNNSWDEGDPSPFADLGAEFLVVNRQGIFSAKEILSVNKFERFCVIGSGSPHAEGAAEALYDSTESATAIAERCVNIAKTFDGQTGGEVHVAEVE